MVTTAMWGQASITSPCDWPVLYTACTEPAPTDETAQAMRRMAIDLLWHWTGRIFGTCQVSVRPCRTDGLCDDCGISTFWGRGPYPTWEEYTSSPLGALGTGFYPVLAGGAWYNCGCGTCLGARCECALNDGTRAIRLPGPVTSVQRVTIDGAELPSTAWRLEGTRLIRTDSDPDTGAPNTWPLTQNLLAPATEQDTFEISYTRGLPVPEGGQIAAGLLACELVKAAQGDPTCGLPQRVQTVTRQGVTVAVLDNFDEVLKGRTGIWLVDAWVASIIAPKRTRPTIVSPDYNSTGNRPPGRPGCWS